jgi:hypothetical protein
MTTETLSERTRRDLGALSHLAGSLMQRCVSTGDNITFETAQKMNAIVRRVCDELRAEGLDVSEISPMEAGLQVPLHLLDTPANRRYLEALVEAHACALEVDRERGYGNDGPAQDLEDLCCEVRMEIFGPGGGRE